MSIFTRLARSIKKRIVVTKIHKIPVNVPVLFGELLTNRYALITGGNSGIGFAMAEAFLRNGANVIISGRNEEKLQDSCNKLKNLATKSKIDFVLLDNNDIQSVKQGFQNALKISQAKLDILVNNAGIICGSFVHLCETDFDKTMNTNLKSAYFLSQLFATHIKAKHSGGGNV